jgi:ectoine hydroxylase-related dioxygenase (phytanoyl-CoA dioxygenase family)
MTETFSSYGVKHINRTRDEIDRHIEALRLVGYTVVEGPWSSAELADFSARLDAAYAQQAKASGGEAALREMGDAHTVRLPLAEDDAFLALATFAPVLEIARRMMDDYIILNQQNGVINPANEAHHQAAYHRDLPFQHFTSSAPIAMNALLCLDPFRQDNGATWVIPASHHWDVCPSIETMQRLGVQITAPAGSYLVMNAMVFHAGGRNTSALPRRAVNHLYSRAFVRQQIDIPSALNNRHSDDPDVARLLGYHDQAPPNAVAWRQRRLQQKKKQRNV